MYSSLAPAVDLVIDGHDPVKVVVPEGRGVAHHEAAVLADHEGVDEGILLLQGQRLSQIADGQLARQGDAVLGAGDGQLDGHIDQRHPFSLAAGAYGYAAPAAFHDPQEGAGAGKAHLLAVDHLQRAVLITVGQGRIVPGLPRCTPATPGGRPCRRCRQGGRFRSSSPSVPDGGR